MPIAVLPHDLSPGDARSREFDPAGVVVHHIRSADDPLFALAYQHLHEEFGAKNEIESPAVLRQRFSLDPARLIAGHSFLYEMLLVRRGEQFAAAIDQTAIVLHEPPAGPTVVVHVSHLLIAPAFRKTGLGGWMRALPLHTARAAMEAAKIAADSPITLAGEVEFADPAHPERLARLRSFERAGFLKVDPAAVPFLQPDFREPAVIDSAGGPAPIPMLLILRRVGREAERMISAGETRRIVAALYHLYAQTFREQEMKPCWAVLDAIPSGQTPIRLQRPTE